MTRVLVVDDERPIRRALAINLRARKYDVTAVGDGRAALAAAAREPPDVVILDLGLPDMEGNEVIEGLRGWTSAPIIVLSARSTQDDKVVALDLGADDYITKPFGMDELLARLRAALRRGAEEPDAPVVETASFTIDLAAKRATRDGQPVRLTPTEWHLVEVLARNEGRLVTQRQLLQEVWGPGYARETNYLRVYLGQLRRKLEPDPAHPGTSSPSRAWATASSVTQPRLLSDTPPPRSVGIAAAAGGVAAATAVIYAVREIAPAVSLGVVYPLVVLAVSASWGLGLGIATSVAGAVACCGHELLNYAARHGRLG
jgi:two-component system KDP operon response regulator KdpE